MAVGPTITEIREAIDRLSQRGEFFCGDVIRALQASGRIPISLTPHDVAARIRTSARQRAYKELRGMARDGRLLVRDPPPEAPSRMSRRYYRRPT